MSPLFQSLGGSSFLGAVNCSWMPLLNRALCSDRDDPFLFSISISLQFSTLSRTGLNSTTSVSPTALHSGSMSAVNLGGRYLCSSQSRIRERMRVQAREYLGGRAGGEGRRERRWSWRRERSLLRRELYFYSSRRVGKPLYIDINDYKSGMDGLQREGSFLSIIDHSLQMINRPPLNNEYPSINILQSKAFRSLPPTYPNLALPFPSYHPSLHYFSLPTAYGHSTIKIIQHLDIMSRVATSSAKQTTTYTKPTMTAPTTWKDRLSAEDYEELVHTFQIFDEDGSGTIDPIEINKVLEELGLDKRSPFILLLINGLKEKNKPLNLDEFIDIIASRVGETKTRDGIKRLFSIYDKDGNGVVDFEQFKTIAKQVHDTINDEDILEMMHSTHINYKTASNQGFSFEEFYNIVSTFNNK